MTPHPWLCCAGADPPGQANLAICSSAVGQRYNCLAFTLEMPFKDTSYANEPLQARPSVECLLSCWEVWKQSRSKAVQDHGVHSISCRIARPRWAVGSILFCMSGDVDNLRQRPGAAKVAHVQCKAANSSDDVCRIL